MDNTASSFFDEGPEDWRAYEEPMVTHTACSAPVRAGVVIDRVTSLVPPCRVGRLMLALPWRWVAPPINAPPMACVG